MVVVRVVNEVEVEVVLVVVLALVVAFDFFIAS